ncbi:MAG: protein kinase [Sandaracinaceae bacterium]|nr:protein kinase [Sandaracinaceae bacterium]MBP7683751.1 protein kinase [Deltaproteobacteria bacterium]MBK7152495.1 protein kinase [Sandaracinaceae bacterium]MBK7773720.1 protein kinase [Sandaracinaceae bacterium]MBK8412748.1 protein kinase [Sandaracinaceae bacterium]
MTEAKNEIVGGRYEVVREIARGGMGVVYEARHRMTKKAVALKVLFPHIGKDPGARQRFLREVSAPAQIGHPGIVEVYDADFDASDGSLFVAMELLVGDTFRDWLGRGGHTRAAVLDKFEEMLDALAAAHRNGIVHRDLKPENVILAQQRDGSVRTKLLDFGIARDLDKSAENVTHTGIAMGTPHYMAPEQAMSARGVTASADVWAIGAMLYEALSGRTPFLGETASAIVVHACTAPHPPLAEMAPSTPPALAALVDRCLSKSAVERPQDAGALLDELRRVRGSSPAQSATPSAPAAPVAPPPNSWGTPLPTPMSATAPAGPATAPSAPPFGSGGQGFGNTPSGFGNTPSGFGSASGAPTTPSPGGGFGAQTTPASGAGYPTPTHATPQPMYSQQPSSGGGNAAWIVGGAGVGLVLLALVGGGAWMLFRGEDAPTDPQVGGPVATPQAGTPGTGTTPGTGGTVAPSGTVGSIILITNITGGQLLVDGAALGDAQHGREVSVIAGSHQVAISQGGTIVAQQNVNVLANVPTQVQLVASAQVPVPTPGVPGAAPETRSGSLAAGDTALNSGEFVDRHDFQWTAGQRYSIDARSTGFDTYLIIKPPTGNQIDNDDRNQAAGTDAGYDLDVTQTGTWQVLVTSFRPGEVGAYTLTVQQVR